MSVFTGTVRAAAFGVERLKASDLETIRQAVAASAEPWTSFTPVWTSTGTAPAFGSSTITGRYRQVGKTVDFGVYILFAGATFGTGVYFFSLPVSAASALVTEQVVPAWGFDFSASDRRPGVVRILNGTTCEPHFSSGLNGQMAATSPFTWANGDWVLWGGTYTVA